MNEARAALVAWFFVCLPSPCGATELFVATDGRDTNPGTKERPLGSLEAARDEIRRRRVAGTLQGDVIVNVRGGIYPRKGSFELTRQDSGTDEQPVLYRGFPGEKTRLSGGRVLPPEVFIPISDPSLRACLKSRARARVRQVDLGALGIDNLGELGSLGGGLELFLGDRRLPLARWPDDGWALARWATVSDDEDARKAVPTTSLRFKHEGAPPRSWASLDRVWLRGYWMQEYHFESWQPRAFDPARREITLGHTAGQNLRDWRRFYAVNALEELDRPGEWYLDRMNALLYLWPPAQFGRAPVQASLLAQPLIALSEVSNVTLRGFTLEVSRGPAVIVSGGASNRIAGCIVRHAQHGAILTGGRKNGVSGCDIYDIAGTGVRLAGGDRRTLEPAGLYAENNHIHDYAQQLKTWQPGIRIEGVGNRVAHNLVHDAPQYAISYHGNDHVIEFNDLHRVCLEMSDVGVIGCGTDWTIRGNVIRYNFVHDIPERPYPGTAGVYLDNCASSAEINGNVFYKTYQAVFIGGGRDNVVENNIFIDCEMPVHLDNRGLRWEHFRPDGPMYDLLKSVDHDRPPYSTRYPALARILDEIPQAPLGNTLRRNVFVRGWTDPEMWCRKTFSSNIDRKYIEMADNFVTEEDPGFVDAAGRDFRLREDSVVFAKIPGFKTIPFERIGLYDHPDRVTPPK